MQLPKAMLEEAKLLVSTGDIDLNQLRDLYRKRTGETCPLTEEQLTAASMTEDDDDDERMQNMQSIINNGLTIAD